MAKIIACPDLHCFWPTYNRPGEDGTPSRLADWRRSMETIFHAARELDVQAILCPGDFFPNSRPSPAQIIEVIAWFAGFEEAGIPVVGCAGNHDLLGPGQPSPVDVVAMMAPDEQRWGWTKPGVTVLPEAKLSVVVLPSIKVSGLDSDPAASAQALAGQLVDIARALCAQVVAEHPDYEIVLMGHWAVSGCRLAAGNSLAATEPTLPLGELQALPVKAVVMGHIHTPQLLSDRPIVLHTGTLERRDFSEEHNECGFWLIDTTEMRATFCPVPARMFATVEWPAAHVEVMGSVARAVYRATEEEAKAFDHGAIIKALEDAGAFLVAGVFPEIVRAERARAAGMTERTSPVEALEQWLNLQADITPETKERVLAAGQKMLEEVIN